MEDTDQAEMSDDRMQQQTEVFERDLLDFDTFVKDAQKLPLEPLMDEERRIFGLYSIQISPFVVFYKVPDNLEEAGLA